MKKLFYFSASVLAMACAAACDNGTANIDTVEEDARFAAIADVFVNKTVIPTYHSLSDHTAELVTALETFSGSKTQSNLDNVCKVFLEARAFWEKSEAFLFGPATVFGIDPHIDSWPLDVDALQRLLADGTIIASLEGEGGDVYAGEQLGNALLGFHGIEYIIFADGSPKTYTEITDTELTYCIAVSGDLRNKCWQMEIAWAGEDGTDGSRYDYVVNELEANVTTDSGSTYGENMLNAGKAGSLYASWNLAMQAIVDGSITIADEVATQKIGRPYEGSSEDDINYIESPYSHMSIQDFYDNMVSIKNVYYGGMDAASLGTASDSYDGTNSLHAYMSEVNPDLDSRVTAAIETALAEINGDGTGMAKPFVNNRTDPSVGEAQDAVSALAVVLEELKNQFVD